MSLQRNSVTGHLLKVAGGHLAKECCCSVGSDPCDCSPALDFVYTVTLSGFTDTWDVFNGAWDVEWTEGCAWYGEYDALGTPTVDLTLSMSWDAVNEQWEILITLPGACDYSVKLDSTDPCATPPPGTYAQVTRDVVCPSKAPDPIGCTVA